jgi:hypothetical protein
MGGVVASGGERTKGDCEAGLNESNLLLVQVRKKFGSFLLSL